MCFTEKWGPIFLKVINVIFLVSFFSMFGYTTYYIIKSISTLDFLNNVRGKTIYTCIYLSYMYLIHCQYLYLGKTECSRGSVLFIHLTK